MAVSNRPVDEHTARQKRFLRCTALSQSVQGWAPVPNVSANAIELRQNVSSVRDAASVHMDTQITWWPGMLSVRTPPPRLPTSPPRPRATNAGARPGERARGWCRRLLGKGAAAARHACCSAGSLLKQWQQRPQDANSQAHAHK